MVACMAQPPILTPEQRTAALKKAAEARTARAELKEKLKMGSVTLADALAKADSDDVIGNMRVLAMLEALPGVGKVKARRLMADIEIAENRKVRGLGPKQRIALLEHLS
jgi:S13-like H2TH domain